VLLLFGEKGEVFRSSESRAGAVALLPDVDVDVVPGAGHALPMNHTEYAAARLVDFLELQRRSTGTEELDSPLEGRSEISPARAD
jgi:pimeloyl-ACP methyl ester carboxylesterase